MVFILELLTTLRAALGMRQYIIANTAQGAAGGVIAIGGALGVSVAFSQWIIAGATLLALLLWYTLTYANSLRKESEPKIDLRFAPTEKYLKNETHQEVSQSSGQPVSAVTGLTQRLLRIEAINHGTQIARDCAAYLIGVHRIDPDGDLINTEFDEPKTLKWSESDDETINMRHGIHHYFRVLTVQDSSGQIEFEFVRPPSLDLHNLCAEPGTYRLRVSVRGDGVESKNLHLKVTTTGTMEGLTVEAG